jgi:hypothetical protein
MIADTRSGCRFMYDYEIARITVSPGTWPHPRRAFALASSRQLQVTTQWRRTCLDLRVPFAVKHPGLRKKIADRDT